MTRFAALLAVVLIVVLAPRTDSRTSFHWSPAPWSGPEGSPAAMWPVDAGASSSASVLQGRSGAPRAGMSPARDRSATTGAPSPAVATTRPIPTPAPLVGWASFYDAGPGEYAALPGFRTSQLGMHVVVCGFPDGQARCVTAAVVTSCGCAGPPPKIIDLSPALFEAVSGMTAAERLIYGVVKVTVEVVR